VSPGVEDAYRQAGFELRRRYVPERIEGARQRSPHAFEPWLAPAAVDGPPIGDPLTELLHLDALFATEPARGAATSDALSPRDPCLRSLHRAGLIARTPDAWRLRSHYLTAFRGLLAVGDHPLLPSLSGVYLGEDGLRLADRILGAPPCRRALDVGSGSGITTVALARVAQRVDAIDVDAACVRATRITAALNGVAPRIRAQRADAITDLSSTDAPYDLIAANPPGVPVPPALSYPGAGNGGEDGLAVIRSILRHAPSLLGRHGRLLMRFEAIGDDRGPYLLRDPDRHADADADRSSDRDPDPDPDPDNLDTAAPLARTVFVESQIAMAARSAISARWAAPLNPHLSPAALLEAFDRHAAELNATRFYTCSLLARPAARPSLEVSTMTPPRPPRTRLPRPAARTTASSPTAALYYARQASLPDGIQELHWAPYRDLVLDRLPEALGRLRATDDIESAVAEVFSDVIARDPIHARALYELVPMALDSAVLAEAA
jgi:SAM-dependent methyltransferase